MSSSGPNIVFIMSDDHAAHALSAYGSRVNSTPNLDRIADGGLRFDNCFCTNALCTPSRASILTGTYSHVNGAYTLATPLDAHIPTFPGLLHEAGYQTAIVGKWHLGHGPDHDPRGFDYWNVLPGQGAYHDPETIEQGTRRQHRGYVTDIITDLSIDWLGRRDPARPFCLLVHHKAPHRKWEPDARHADLYQDVHIPEPSTLRDDYVGRAAAAAAARMRVAHDLDTADLKGEPPPGLSPDERLSWNYQRYIKDYLRCIASMDDNVGRLLDYLDDAGVADETIVVYTSDQGFFLGDHGWYDKRFMYEESLRMPLLVRWPQQIRPGLAVNRMVTNVDFAPTLLELAGLPTPPGTQGRSFAPLLRGDPVTDWPTSVYYRFWAHGGRHAVCAHYGVRTQRHKLICYYGDGLGLPGTTSDRYPVEWELFDLERDPAELTSVHADPAYRAIRDELTAELARLQHHYGDEPYPGAA